MVNLLSRGDWGPGRVAIAWTDSTWSAPPDVEALIQTAWTRAAARPGVFLFDGPMCRLERWHVDDQGLHLVLSRTSYRLFLGTNMTHPELAALHGPGVLANPVGLSALVETSDGWLLLGRRSPRVAYYPSRTHPFAGALEPADDLDVFQDMARELREELGFVSSDLMDLRCRGIVQDGVLLQPELVFHARTARTRAQVESGLDDEEHHDVTGIRVDAAAVTEALDDPTLTPVAQGTLRLFLESLAGR